MNQICITCKINIDEINYLKDRTVCKSCCNKNRRKDKSNTIIKNEIGTSTQQPKIENIKNSNHIKPSVSTYENHACVVISPRNFGKTFYMLKVLEKIGNKRPIHIITRPPNQYPNYKTSNEIKPMDKYTGGVITFDDLLGAWNRSQVDEFFRRGRHKKLTFFYISQSYFSLSRQSIRNKSDRLKLFKQTLRGVQNMYYDIGVLI